MKKYILGLVALVGALVLTGCKNDGPWRTIFGDTKPTMTASINESSLLYGDTMHVTVKISDDDAPLSTLKVQIVCGRTQLSETTIRTKGNAYEEVLAFPVPFGPNMEEGAELKAYLTAESVEGAKTEMIVGGCTGKRPEITSMYIMPPTIDYKTLGKGIQMVQSDTNKYVFTAENLTLPKSFKCLMATVGTKFGRVDYSKPVFGMVDGSLSMLTPDIVAEIQQDGTKADNYAIDMTYDDFVEIHRVTFNTLTFTFDVDGKIVTPVEYLDVNTDLEEAPSYISSSSVAKLYRGGKVYFGKDTELELRNVGSVSDAYNLDYMEPTSGNKVKFLGETGMYYVSYDIANDYLVVEPLYDVEYPDVMYLCGVGMSQPHKNAAAAASTTSGWGFDSPNQNFVGRMTAAKVYQFTVYMRNDEEDSDHPGFGSVNFKFFHQHGWGGEEASTDYKQVCPAGMTIVSSTEESNVGNWWSDATPFSGVYRITLDMNKMTTTYEKVR